MKNSVLLLLLLLVILSCSNNKEELIKEYEKMYEVIKNEKNDSIYQILDLKSQQYISFLADTTNWKYDKIKNYGEKLDIKYSTLEFYTMLNKLSSPKKNNDKSFILTLFGIMEVPLFNYFTEPRFLEEKTKSDDGENVIIAYNINDEMYASTKVHIHKNDVGEYKLDIFPLFKVNETMLKLRFKIYKRIKEKENPNLNYEEIINQFFIEKNDEKYLRGLIRMKKKQ